MNIDEITTSKAKFLRCENGVAYYTLKVPYCELVYSFPVPLNTMQDKVLVVENDTVHFMDYINRAIQEGTLIKNTA